MLILGIETSCDKTSASILEAKGSSQDFEFRPLSNIVSSQIKLHAKYGGVVPNLASREHLKNINPVVATCFKQANLEMNDIDLITVTHGPGLIPSLLIGVNYAKTLALIYKKPILGINHLAGHLYSFLLSQWFKDFDTTQKIFPAICLLVSGGHTQVMAARNFFDFKIIGETRDDASGECFDKSARILGLGYPGGPEISKQAQLFKDKKTKANARIKLPRPMINTNDYDFSFSGLKTAVLYLAQELKSEGIFSKLKPQFAYEIQEAICDVLVSKTLKAAQKLGARSIIISGGVSANTRLREKFQEEISKKLHGVHFFAPDLKLTTDNALMIAVAGFFKLRYLEKKKQKPSFLDWKKIEADANLRLVKDP